MIRFTEPVDLPNCRLPANQVPTGPALRWLQKHLWGIVQITTDTEHDKLWRVRWAAWPALSASGAGYTFDDAVSRCFQMAYREYRDNLKNQATDQQLREAGL